MGNCHTPVMLKEVIYYLDIKPGNWYVDCNLGGGGHTSEILKRGGKVLGIDVDPQAIVQVAQRQGLTTCKINNHLQATSDNLIICQSNFTNLKEIIHQFGVGSVYGVLFDLGLSSNQLDEASRGFSFNTDSLLDMRMDPGLQVSAVDLVNGLYEGELAELFQKYGEELFAKPIARKIVELRQNKKIETTSELAQIILSVKRKAVDRHIHPATKVFQALRIAVNDELNSLKNALPQALDILAPGGRLVVISFHSLEDRIVKIYFQDEYKNSSIKILTQKPLTPTENEVEQNPRSRSGKLRAAQKL